MEEAAPAQRFAQPAVPDPLADDFSARDSVFCSTCLKNQQLYTYNLSQFLPDPDDPDYEQLEAQLPEYKIGLEQRYPQCCARCEPKVRAQLHQATYNARSDHLRRVLERSRQRRIASRLGWRSLLVAAAGMSYFSSLALQLMWHLYGSQVSSQEAMRQIRPTHCLTQRPFLSECLNMMEPLVGLSLNLGLLSIWWNPKWQYRLASQEGRLAGLKEYYLVQLALLGSRLGAWIVLVHVPLDQKMQSMLHACSAVAITVIAGWSLCGIIEVQTAHPVNWHQDPAPLLSNNQFVPPSGPSQSKTQQDRSGPFSVGTLATPPAPIYPAWRPPTPPEDTAESMDWTPSQPTFQPELKELRYRSTEPSPFHGSLPTLNGKGVYKNVPQNKAARREAIGLPPGFFDRPANPALPSRQTSSTADAIVPPKFFGHDKDVDTGLESIFGTVFSLQDRSLEPQANSPCATNPYSVRPTQEIPGMTRSSRDASPAAIFSGISFSAVLIAVALWTFEATVAPKSSQLGYYVVLLSACIPIGHLLLLVSSRGMHGHLSRFLLFTLETVLLIGIALLREPFGDLFRDLWNKLGIAVVGLLLPQEFLQMQHSSSNSRTGQHHEIPPQPNAEAMGTANVLIPPATPTMNRSDSSESIESRSSIATTSTAGEWQTPKLSRGRFELHESPMPAPGRATGRNVGSRKPQPFQRNMLGIDGLSLSDRAPAGSSANSGQRMGASFGTSWGLDSSGTNIAGPRARRRF